MPVCSYPGECTDYAMKNSDRCETHQIAKGKASRKNESAQLKKIKLAAVLQIRNDKERADRNAHAKAVLERQRRRADLQADVIRNLKHKWSGQIQTVVDQVLVLRTTNPNANAGNNAVGNTAGGNLNPIKLVMSGPTHGVKLSQVCHDINGFDSSDSGVFKFRRENPPNKDILVHAS